MTQNAEEHNRLENFPITLFATVMGLTGLGIAFQKAQHLFGIHTQGVNVYIYIVTAWFFFLCLVYAVKFTKFSSEVKAEFSHPVKINFFPAISISLLLMAIAYMPIDKTASRYFWYAGTFIHLIFTLVIMNKWFYKDYKIEVFNPAWFIPVVGTILVPIAGVAHANKEISWFFFSIGLLFWIVLLAILIYRIIFHQKMAVKFMPTLFILIAPPAVGFIAYVKMTGTIDSFARVMYYFALFTTIKLFTMFFRFKEVPYFVSWWAYTFPMAAITLSTFLMYEKLHLGFFKYLYIAFLVLTVCVDLFVVLNTLRAAKAKKICVPE